MIKNKITLTLFVLFSASSALADNNKTCYGAKCNGKDPLHHKGCKISNTTKPSYYFLNGKKIGSVTLKYSKNCNANWSVVQTYKRGWEPHHAEVKYHGSRHSDRQWWFNDGKWKKIYSDMIDGSQEVQGLGSFRKRNGDNTSNHENWKAETEFM